MPTLGAHAIKVINSFTARWIKNHATLHSLVALAVLTVGVGATLYYWQTLRQGVHQGIDSAFVRQRQQLSEAVQSRLSIYENLLRASAGLISIQDNLSQGDWEKYQDAYDLDDKYPDIEGVGIASFLRSADLPAYMERRVSQGEANFKIVPSGNRNQYMPVTYNVRYHGTASAQRGFDIYTDPVRRQGAEQALKMNSMAMTGNVTAFEADNKGKFFVLYYPIYKKDQPHSTPTERQAALLGFAYITVNTKTFLDAILKANNNPHIAMKLEDDTNGNANGQHAYQSDNFTRIEATSDALMYSRHMDAYGHAWLLTMAAAPQLLGERERKLPEQALWRGLVTCVFFSGLVWYLITDRERKYARQKREEVQTAKDDLLSLASHQLRTPATVVKQYVGMLLQGYAGDLTPQQLSMLDNAYTSNERQLEIINQLLYVARLDAGRITLHRRNVDINQLIRDTATDLEEALNTRKQRLKFRLPKQSIHAQLDPHYIRMVLENLLSNAIKYTPEKGSISIELRRTITDVAITVRDNGVGIPDDVRATIFEKFTRVDNELSNDVNGSGVGLYLTRQIVELHGGTITVEPNADKGSAFTVRLPLGESSESR